MNNEEKYIACYNKLKSAEWAYVFRQPKYMIRDGHTWLPSKELDDTFEQSIPTDEELQWIETELFKMVAKVMYTLQQQAFLKNFYAGEADALE